MGAGGARGAASLVGACLASLALATVGRVPAAAAVTSPRCASSDLVVWLDTQGNGAAGSIYYLLEFTNLSGHRCTLTGYPGVSAVDLSGRRLGSAASRDPAHPVRPVSLAAGATAKAVLRIVEALNYPRSTCRPTMAAGLRVYPPNQTTAKVVPFPFLGCARTGPTFLGVQAVQGS